MSCPCAWSWCCFKVSTGDNNNITLQQFQPRHNSPQVPVNNNNNNIILQQPQSVSKTIKNDHNIILFSDPPVPSIIVSPKFVFLIKWHQGKHFFQIFNWWLLYFIGWWGTCWHQHLIIQQLSHQQTPYPNHSGERQGLDHPFDVLPMLSFYPPRPPVPMYDIMVFFLSIVNIIEFF